MSPKVQSTGEILEILAEGPARIEAATRGLSDDALCLHPEPDEWSVVEILTHLRACADVWGSQRIWRMLEDDEPSIRAVNPRTWVQETNYSELPFSVSIDAFAKQRQRLLRRLETLDVLGWARGATFTGFGKPRRYTVLGEAEALARHERSHIRQLERRVSLLRSGR
jgi:hypothetical protein